MKFLNKCRICGSEKYETVLIKDKYCFCRCSNCSLVFLNSTFSDIEIKEMYSYYSNCRQNFNSINAVRYKELLRKFGNMRSNNNILDIGCGIGHFLNVASLNGWNAYGTEISEQACCIAKQKNKNIYCDELKNIKFQNGYFDVITMFEVLEHVENPSTLLEECQRVLRAGGILYLTTPNYQSLDRLLTGKKWKIYHPEHLSYFDTKSLYFLLSKTGFKIRSLETKNIAIYDIIKILFWDKRNSSVSHNNSFNEEQIREISERNKFARFLKIWINSVIKKLKCGQTMYIIAEKK
jgi:2-polyprenyl-3-methyl-5-hydroxy-6-metoxy-1,4-benzoquinol methylase